MKKFELVDKSNRKDFIREVCDSLGTEWFRALMGVSCREEWKEKIASKKEFSSSDPYSSSSC